MGKGKQNTIEIETLKSGIWIAWAFCELYVFGTCRKTEGDNAKRYIMVSCFVGRFLMSCWGAAILAFRNCNSQGSSIWLFNLTIITKERQATLVSCITSGMPGVLPMTYADVSIALVRPFLFVFLTSPYLRASNFSSCLSASPLGSSPFVYTIYMYTYIYMHIYPSYINKISHQKPPFSAHSLKFEMSLIYNINLWLFLFLLPIIFLTVMFALC